MLQLPPGSGSGTVSYTHLDVYKRQPKLLKEALLWGAEVRTVVATAGVDLPELPLGVRQVEVPAEVMKSLSPMETPQGTLFICAIHTEPLPEMLTGRRYVVLDTLQDPGNVGTILRTADAFHADGMFLVNGCADLYNPKTLRATTVSYTHLSDE